MKPVSKYILLIEDDNNDARLTMLAFEKAGIKKEHLVRIESGEDILAYLTGKEDSKPALPCLPKVIILDLDLPGLHGLDVLRILKNDPYTSFIPVVILSGSTKEEDILRSYQNGANSYIIKPVQYENFMTIVSELGLYWGKNNILPSDALEMDYNYF